MFEFSLEFSAPHTPHTYTWLKNQQEEQQKQARRAQEAQKSPEPRLAGLVISWIASWYGGGGAYISRVSHISH